MSCQKTHHNFYIHLKCLSFFMFLCPFSDSSNRRHHAIVPVAIFKPFSSVRVCFDLQLFFPALLTCMFRLRYHKPIKIIFVSWRIEKREIIRRFINETSSFKGFYCETSVILESPKVSLMKLLSDKT